MGSPLAKQLETSRMNRGHPATNSTIQFPCCFHHVEMKIPDSTRSINARRRFRSSRDFAHTRTVSLDWHDAMPHQRGVYKTCITKYIRSTLPYDFRESCASVTPLHRWSFASCHSFPI